MFLGLVLVLGFMVLVGLNSCGLEFLWYKSCGLENILVLRPKSLEDYCYTFKCLKAEFISVVIVLDHSRPEVLNLFGTAPPPAMVPRFTPPTLKSNTKVVFQERFINILSFFPATSII